MRLEGKRILITGASSGVGAAAVARFAAEGARLALLARSEEALRAVAERDCPDAIVLPVDLADRAAAEAAVAEAIAGLGGLDIVVSNHAAAVFGHFLEVHPDDFDRTVAVTFGGAVNVIRAALPALRESRGAVVATGSLMTRVPLPTWAAYSAAKHGLRGFLNSLRIEEREQRSGVRVSMVHPGPIDSPLFAQSSSATGLSPRIPPDTYTADSVARALVAVAIRPVNEVVLGGETRALDLAFTFARPLAERALLTVDRWYRSGDERAPSPGSLWDAPPATQTTGGAPSRDSLFAPLQLGRGVLPAPSTPLRLVRNLAAAGMRAVQLASTLSRPVPEQPAPQHSVQDQASARFTRSRGKITV